MVCSGKKWILACVVWQGFQADGMPSEFLVFCCEMLNAYLRPALAGAVLGLAAL